MPGSASITADLSLAILSAAWMGRSLALPVDDCMDSLLFVKCPHGLHRCGVRRDDAVRIRPAAEALELRYAKAVVGKAVKGAEPPLFQEPRGTRDVFLSVVQSRHHRHPRLHGEPVFQE